MLPNGLRFYFASYEPFDSSGSRPPKHKQDGSKTTLVIVPTTHKLDDTGMVIQHPYRPGEILPFDLLDDPTARPEYDKTLAEQNDGQICPPPPPLI